MKTIIPFLFLSILLLSSCGSGDAGLIADKYHELIKKEKYNEIVSTTLSSKATSITSEKDWAELLKWVAELDEIKSIEKISGFNSSMDNGITTVTLRYEYKYKNEPSLFERIILVREAGDFEIAGITWNSNLDELPMPKSKSRSKKK
jgi:hypothetical protein